jgi:hypothetical protein
MTTTAPPGREHLCHALVDGDHEPGPWLTACGTSAPNGGVVTPGPGRTWRQASVDCPVCLAILEPAQRGAA